LGSRTLARTAGLDATLDRLLAGEVDASTLAKLSLTPTESRVAMALFKGQSVGAYAKEAGISINTVRWYVKQIHAKTGVRCQTELFRLLLKCNGSRVERGSNRLRIKCLRGTLGHVFSWRSGGGAYC